jgi:hypothetical protein
MGEIINLAQKRFERWAKKEMFNQYYTFDEWFAMMDEAGAFDDEDRAEKPLLEISWNEAFR